MRVLTLLGVLTTVGLASLDGLPPPAGPSAVPDAAAKTARTIPHQVVRVTSPEARRPVEVSVAINPSHPDHVVAVSNQAGRAGEPSSNHVYVSWDGGRTWKTVAAPNPDRRSQGDDAIAFGLDGMIHRTY